MHGLRFVDLTYAAGRLSWPGGDAPAACGRGGVRADKREGDGASPAGTFPLLCCYYRPDRLAPPRTGLAADRAAPERRLGRRSRRPAIQPPGVAALSRRATRRCGATTGSTISSCAIGYNTDPPVPGRGSAIFLHVAEPDFAPTAGCIAIARDVLAGLLPLLGPGSTITIRP